jgi:hypothetical protein
MKFTNILVAIAATSAFASAGTNGTDDCATPTAIAGSGSFTADTSASTTGVEGQAEGLCYSFGSSAVDNDIWYSWTANATGTATVSLCGNTFDSKLAAYPGAGCPTTGSAIACNDDSCGLQSEISFAVTSGTAYTLQVGTFPGSSGGAGSMSISIAVPANPDDCATPDVISGQGLFAFDNSAATTGTEGQAEASCLFFGITEIDNDVWFSWTADVDGTAIIETCGQTFVDTKLAVYPGGGCPTAGSALACNDDNCGLQSGVLLPVTAGTSYMIQVGTFPGSSGGTGNLDVSILPPAPPLEDDCATPLAIAGDGTFAWDQTLATTGAEGQTEAACLFFGSTAIENDVWFSWTAAASGNAVFTMCGNTSVDTKMAIYPGGGCPTAGSSLACNDDSCGLQSEIALPVTAGTSYMIQVGTFPGASGGAGSLTINTTTVQPPEDDCSTPAVIAGQGTFAYDNSGFTVSTEGQNEVLCYAFGSSAIDNDAWFSWTADADGLAVVSTCNSSPDTKIAAYDGSGCPAASALACNDDTCGLQSEISFVVTSGTTYTIQAGNFPGASGGPSSLDIAISPITPGTAYCFCDGSGLAAPCSNTGAAGNGCANSADAAGANLDGAGDAVVGADTLVLTATGLPSGSFCLIFQGDNNNQSLFGDGIKCAGGAQVRMGTMMEVGGSVDTASMGVTVSVKGAVNAGDLRYYQAWYRDPAGPCGNFFNTTNGYEIQW